MMLEHTKRCIKAREQRVHQQNLWRARWPNHCPHCEGNTDCGTPCPHCLFELKCPRCGMDDAMDECDATIPCKYCGYIEGQGCPPDHECTCRVAKVEELLRREQRVQSELAVIERQLHVLRRS